MIDAFGRLRTLLAAVLLAALGLRGNLPPVVADRQALAQRSGADLVTREALRYQPLVASLPESGTIGYLLLEPPESLESLRFMLAQYELTPRLVVTGSAPDYVIVSPQAAVADDVARGGASQDPRLQGFVLYERFPNGMRVFRRFE